MQKPSLPVATPSATDPSTAAAKPRQKRGFALLNKERQREIASKGGMAAHLKGTAHEFSSDEARVSGTKGGLAVSRDREHMARIGRAGGLNRRKNIDKANAEIPGAPVVAVTPVTDVTGPADVGAIIESIGC